MLDAAACGIPLVVSDGIVYRDHVDGNGLIHEMNNLDDLVRCLLILRDQAERGRLGSAGARKMSASFSWKSVAMRRLKDYEKSMNRSAER